jgi:hypothetical protein
LRLLWHSLTRLCKNCYALIAILASKVVMSTYWQNTIYMFLVVLLMCERGSENSPPTSNNTYLPDYFVILFATWVFFVLLSQKASAFVCISLLTYQHLWRLRIKERFLFLIENWTTISMCPSRSLSLHQLSNASNPKLNILRSSSWCSVLY